jgi:thioredoxin-like negative regulator of GroEL
MIYQTTELRETQATVSILGGVGILYLTASWCGPCKVFGPQVEAFSEEHEEVHIAKHDIDTGDVAQHFGVRSIPTIIAFVNGKEVARKSGSLSKKDLESMLIQATL